MTDIAAAGNAELSAEVIEFDNRGGNRILNDLTAFCGRFIAYPSEHEQIAHVLWIAHSHLMHAWDSTPRLAFLSPDYLLLLALPAPAPARLLPRPYCLADLMQSSS